MSPSKQIKSLTRRIDKLGSLLLVIPVLVAMTACTGEMDVTKKDELASREGTHGADVVIMPDSQPSVGDGKVYWATKANCASCHGMDGKGVAGKNIPDLTDVEWMRGRKPMEQYKAVAFGKGVVTKMPVLSSEGKTENMDPVEVRTFEHPAYKDKYEKRILWSLIFYSRSLAAPLLPTKEHMEMKAVFGANCAVCHGTRGAGDGPLNKGLVLQPAPANFNKFPRFYDRTDEQLWDHIAHGIKWEGMPNFLGKEDKKNKVKFDAEYIWKLVQYVRNFHEIPEYELEEEKARELGFIPKDPADSEESEKKDETKAEAETKNDAEVNATNNSSQENTNKAE